MMTQIVKGKTKEEAHKSSSNFTSLVTGEVATTHEAELGKLAVFAGVSEFPARVKCATLAWHTLQAALWRVSSKRSPQSSTVSAKRK